MGAVAEATFKAGIRDGFAFFKHFTCAENSIACEMLVNRTSHIFFKNL